MQNDLDNIYMKKSAVLFGVNFNKMPIMKLSNLFPVLNPFLIFVMKSSIMLINALRRFVPSLMRYAPISPFILIKEQVSEVVRERITSGRRRTDLLQLMLDAAKAEEAQVSFILDRRTNYLDFFRNMKLTN